MNAVPLYPKPEHARVFRGFWKLGNVVPGIRHLSVGPRPSKYSSSSYARRQLAKETSWRGMARIEPGEDPPFAEETAHPNSVDFNEAIVKFPGLRKLELSAMTFSGGYPGIYRLANL